MLGMAKQHSAATASSQACLHAGHCFQSYQFGIVCRPSHWQEHSMRPGTDPTMSSHGLAEALQVSKHP
jgi:hypothetical protein